MITIIWSALCRNLGCKSVLVVTDPGLRRLGLVDTVLEGAESAGLGVTVHDQVLYCTVLYCTVLYSTVLYCTILYRPIHRYAFS